MADHDLLVSPTLTTPAFPIGQFTPAHLQGESLQSQLLGWLLTYPFNMTATPSASIPAGFTATGLPVGLQISGGHRADQFVLQASAAFERARPWIGAKPPVS
jgi:aspartyl-tRNA(Asn)/glutamyl-tRNA(Gln) amidotransferase subunit A